MNAAYCQQVMDGVGTSVAASLRAQYGDAPSAWYPHLTGEPWPGEDAAGSPWTEAAE